MFKHLIKFHLILILGISASLLAEEPTDKKPSANAIKLPGIEIDTKNRIVDVAGTVSLREGLLELIACTEGTKEHEAIIRIDALPMHMHTALLLVGARNGNPAMRKPINKEKTRWMHLPPHGDPIKVSLVTENSKGETTERPISEFITRTEGDPYMPDFGRKTARDEDEEEEAFPDTFIFTGSHLIENSKGNKEYLADQSGHVITISTFGDEVLGLQEIQSRENGELVWGVDATHLPPVDTAVKLRLRPQN